MLKKTVQSIIIFIASNPYLRNFIRIIFRLIKIKEDIPLKVGNDIIYVNSIDRLIAGRLWKSTYLSKFETELYKKIVKKNMTVLDMGANIGFFTILFAQLVGKDGKVFAFEPDPNNFRLLKKMLKQINITMLYA